MADHKLHKSHKPTPSKKFVLPDSFKDRTTKSGATKIVKQSNLNKTSTGNTGRTKVNKVNMSVGTVLGKAKKK